MEKRGVSQIVALVLLIAIGFVFAGLIFSWARIFIVALGPPDVNCNRVNFEADIFVNGDGKIFLDVTNNGNIKLIGFIVKSADAGQTLIVEELDAVVEPGESESFELANLGTGVIGSRILIVPVVIGENTDGETELVCGNSFGVEAIPNSN